MRLVNGFRIFSVPAIMFKVKLIYEEKIKKLIQEDPVMAENIAIDNNNIAKLIIINFMFRIVKLIIIIFNISYFLGFLWYIFCDLGLDIASHRAYQEKRMNQEITDLPKYANGTIKEWSAMDQTDKGHILPNEYFITHFEIDKKPELETMVVLSYFAFTSLSTVGFGDYNPRSDLERVFCAFILLFGVAIFSYIMGIFIEMLEKYQNLCRDLDDGDQLTRFLGLFTFLNDKVPIKEELRLKIEAHFDYKWRYDRNQAIDDEEERAILE